MARRKRKSPQSADRIIRDLELEYSLPMPSGIEDVVKAMR